MKYATQEQFEKMTKTQRLSMETTNELGIEISRAVFIPIREKTGGYNMGSLFVLTKKGWSKNQSYDCWNITNDHTNPVELHAFSTILRGDFQYGGFNIFEFIRTPQQKVKATVSYGCEIILSKK